MANKDSDLRSYGLRLEGEDEHHLVFAFIEEHADRQLTTERIFVEKVHECWKRMDIALDEYHNLKAINRTTLELIKKSCKQ